VAKKERKKRIAQMESQKDTLSFSQDSVPLRWYFIVVVFIFAVTIGVYWNTLDNEFLTFDDKKYIYQNTLVTGDGGVGAIWADFFNEKPKLHYYPLTFTTFWLEHKLVGLSPPGANISESVVLPALVPRPSCNV
jgi:hypothetical protein